MMALALFSFSGCRESMVRRALPAPVRDEVQVTLEGRIYRWWGADNFEFGDYQELHYILVQGIHSPPPNHELFDRSREVTFELTRNKHVTINVRDRDRFMREIAEVLIPSDDLDQPLDLGLELIERGWAEYNGADFEKADSYRDAELGARASKRGMWANIDSLEQADRDYQGTDHAPLRR